MAKKGGSKIEAMQEANEKLLHKLCGQEPRAAQRAPRNWKTNIGILVHIFANLQHVLKKEWYFEAADVSSSMWWPLLWASVPTTVPVADPCRSYQNWQTISLRSSAVCGRFAPVAFIGMQRLPGDRALRGRT
eukprot:g11620.t1